MKRSISHSKHGLITVIVIISFLFVFISSPSFANPIKKEHAQKAVHGWLHHNRTPMDCLISDIPAEAILLVGEDEKTLCYIVNLEPTGFVIVSADDEIEPVIAFSSTGFYDGNESSPLTTLLKKDMSSRLGVVKQKLHKGKTTKASGKWKTLIDADAFMDSDSPGIIAMGAPSVSQTWVDPFLQSEWD